MARPRTISDDDALAAAQACITEHGPGVSLATLSEAIGLSPPALVKRFGSKEELLFRALLPREQPRWVNTLLEPPGSDPVHRLSEVLVELCTDFEQVGPALAALRMSALDVASVFPPHREGPPVAARALLASWLRTCGVTGDTEVRADAAVGAAEARGLLGWVGEQMVAGTTEDWAHQLARWTLHGSATPSRGGSR